MSSAISAMAKNPTYAIVRRLRSVIDLYHSIQSWASSQNRSRLYSRLVGVGLGAQPHPNQTVKRAKNLILPIYSVACAPAIWHKKLVRVANAGPDTTSG